MKKLLVLGYLPVFILAVLIGGALLLTRVPPIAEQLPANGMPLLVTLPLPPNGSTLPFDQPTTVTAEAIGGKPIVALELWIDGTLVQKKDIAPGSLLTYLAAFWTWTPSTGEHTLIVRARDAEGNVAPSNTVRVVGSKEEQGSLQANYAPEPGESVLAIAAKLKIKPQEILDLNPQINSDGPLPANQAIEVPLPVPTSTAPDPASSLSSPSAPSSPPAPPSEPSVPAPGNAKPWWFWIKNLLKASELPSAPTLWAKVENCSVRLTVKDSAINEDGFFIYRLSPASLSFDRIATLDAHTSSSPFDYVDSGIMSGEWQYSIAAFNTKGESPSGIVKTSLSGSQSCVQLHTPALTLKKGKLTFSQKVNQTYCYVALNDGNWTRMPPAPNAFISPDKNGDLDVSPWINQMPPGDVKLGLDCWGWQGDALASLGKTQQTFKKDQIGPVQVAAGNLKLTGELENLPLLKPTGSEDKIWLAPPTNLNMTWDAKTCTDHMPIGLALLGGAFTCQGAISHGYAILVWNWQPAFCPLGEGCVSAGEPDGYRLYREGFPVASLFKETKEEDFTVAMFPYPAPPWAPPPNMSLIQKIQYQLDKSRCYTVRAYKNTEQGILESDDSPKLCLGDVQISKSITLKPAASLRRWRYNYENCPDDKGVAPEVLNIPGPVAAGYEHNWYACDYWNVYYRGAVWFDLSQVPVPILYATLKYNYVDGVNFEKYTPSSAKLSCADYLMLGTEDWRGDPYGDKPISIPAEDYAHIPSSGFVTAGQPFWIDVTTAVNQWLNGQRPNYGFVLRGFSEDLSLKDSERCDSVYDNFELKVERYGW